MKKMFSLVLTLLMVFSLAACGGGGDGGSGGKKDSGLPGIDMKSAEVQTVSSDRATLDVLNETFFTYLGGLNYFSDDEEQSKLTYADLKEHIGVDCSEYQYQEEYQPTSAASTHGTPMRMTPAPCPFSSVTTAS